MNNSELQKWGQGLIDKLNKDWSHIPEGQISGYSIFYSPISFQPDLMVIGDNPGGSENIQAYAGWLEQMKGLPWTLKIEEQQFKRNNKSQYPFDFTLNLLVK